MNSITVKLTKTELDLLTSLASDQLFRREFIDPKLPGYRGNPVEIRIGKDLVTRLRARLTVAAAQNTSRAVAGRKR